MTNAPHTTLQFLGAAGTVTGSKYLLTVGERRVLVDAGLFQGEKQWRAKNWEEFPLDPRRISDVVLTHGHLDHCGYLPALVRAGFDGPVWCTEGTRRLAEIVMRDSAKLQEQEAADANEAGWSKHSPALALYTEADVDAAMPLFVPLEYDADFDLDDGLTLRLTRAGHILGSASATIWTPTTSVLFSGDLGRHDHPVLKPRGTPPGSPYVVLESTYGDREHPEPDALPHEGFADVVRRTLGRGGSVLVPAFAVDRTEVVLQTISELRRTDRIPPCPVYVNSPMATRALDVYLTLTDELRDDLHPEEFLEFPDLRPVRSAEESRALTEAGGHGPSIIIASSGMATGGRVLHHLERMLPDHRNAVILTGYQAVGTRGWQLLQGAKQLKMRGQYVPVKAEVLQDGEFSVHADCSDLLDWVRELDPAPRTVFCTHGEPDAAAALAARVESEFAVQTVVPAHGEIVVLNGVRPGGASDAAALPPAPVAPPRTPTRGSTRAGPQAAAAAAAVVAKGAAASGVVAEGAAASGVAAADAVGEGAVAVGALAAGSAAAVVVDHVAVTGADISSELTVRASDDETIVLEGTITVHLKRRPDPG